MTCPYLIASVHCPSPKMTTLNRERQQLCNIFKTAEWGDQLKATPNDSRVKSVKSTTLVLELQWRESPKFPERKDSSNVHMLEKYSTQINTLLPLGCCVNQSGPRPKCDLSF